MTVWPQQAVSRGQLAAPLRPSRRRGTALHQRSGYAVHQQRWRAHRARAPGCLRTRVGVQHFCVIRSCLDILRKQGHGMLVVLQRAFSRDPTPLSA